jgi:hypothetical protein
MVVRLSALRAGRPLTPEKFLELVFLEAESTPGWLKGLSQLKNAMTSSGIEPATFRLVA